MSLREVGYFNATIIERGSEFAGRRFNYAGDELTPNEMAAVLAGVTGSKLKFEEWPTEEISAMSEDLALMYQWFDRVGYSAGIVRLRHDYPDVGWTSFEEWAKVQDWQQLLS